ncbi:hypothetical protein Tco_0435777 [Tanacetum coccineum]
MLSEDFFIVVQRSRSSNSQEAQWYSNTTPAEQEAGRHNESSQGKQENTRDNWNWRLQMKELVTYQGDPDESTVITRASSERNWIKTVIHPIPLLILQSSISHLLNQYLLLVKNLSLQLSPPTSALQQSSSVLEMYYNLPPRTVSPDPVAIVASRAVDPVGSPSSTTIDQDEQSTSTSPTNQEIQSQVTHQGPVPQFMAPDHSSSGPVLHEMTSDQIRSDLTPNRQETSVDNISSDLVSNKQKASDYDISGPVPPRKNVVSLADKTDSSQKEIEFLFNHFFEEYFSPINVHAEENNNDQAANASHEYQWTKDHPLEQVIDNPTNPVQTRQQLATDPEMYMFALTVSTEEPKNSKEAMANSAWIEAMQDELH